MIVESFFTTTCVECLVDSFFDEIVHYSKGKQIQQAKAEQEETQAEITRRVEIGDAFIM